MWSRTEGGCVEARGVPLRRRRDGRVWKEQWAKANVRRNGTDPSEKRLSSCARRFVCLLLESKIHFRGRIPIERRVRARGAVGRYHAEF